MARKEVTVTPLYYDHVLQNQYQVVVQVGGRFSGKSHNEQVRLVTNLNNHKDYKLLIIEDLETGMADGFHAGLRDRIEEFGHTDIYNPRSRTAHIKNQINGNQVLFRGYATDQQRLNVKKLSGITEIMVEEGEWMDYDSFISLLQQLRGGSPEDRKLTILMNPVNPECFVNQMLIESPPDRVIEYFEGTMRPKVFERHITTEFELEGRKIKQTVVILVVLSTHFDNPFLTLEQRASIEQLKETDQEKYLQLGEARFIRPSGTYFKEFKREIHVIEPFKIPEHWDKYTVTDYGLDMEATLWIAVDEYGKAYAYKESHKPDLIISEAAKEIRRVNGGDKIRIKNAPPDLWNRRQETGKSAWDIFAENGVVFVKAGNNREDGCMASTEWLKPYEVRDTHTGQMVMTADFKFFSNCENAIRCIPQVLRDEKNPNVYATDPHDITHIIDAFRYFAIMRTAPSAKKAKKLPQEHLPEALKSRPQPKNTGLAGDPQGGLTW